MEILQQIILPLIIILILLYTVWNLLRKVEKLEDGIDESDKLIESAAESVNRALARMREVDRVGSFEADDESGFIYKEIQAALDKLNNEINKNA